MDRKSKSHLFVHQMEAAIYAGLSKPWLSAVISEDEKEIATPLGWNIQLLRAAEAIHHLMDENTGNKFVVEVLAAPPPDSDLTYVTWRFLHWTVKDVAMNFKTEKNMAVYERALPALERLSKGLGSGLSNQEKLHALSAATASYLAYGNGEKLIEFLRGDVE